MTTLRQWKLDPSQPYVAQLAADARLSRTSYVDDQVWDVVLGEGDSPALALHTRYGGRAGLVSIVPMWHHDGRVFYQAQTYHSAPIITHLLPDTLVLEAMLLPDVKVDITLRAFESQVVGGMFVLHNTGKQIVKMRLDLFGHVGIGGGEQKTRIIPASTTSSALYFGGIGNLHPVVMLDNGNDEGDPALSARLGSNVTLPPNGKATLRWVHVGLPTIERGLMLAQRWLDAKWQPYLDASERLAAAIPNIETGDDDFDVVLASAYNVLVQSFLRPAGHFPRGTFVATRTSGDGFSRKGDGSDYPRSWNGQDPLLAYLAVGAMATIDPALAQGILSNYLAVQAKDGSIDYKPGAAGQRAEMLNAPILARMAWRIIELTDDEKFLQTVFPHLLRFFERWLAADFDRDGDGFPEWQDERQMGYVAFPTFALGQSWAQGLHVGTVEAPDLAAYLLAEANALQKMAERLKNKTAVASLKKQIKALQEHLAQLWNGTYYAYRDRDTHATNTSIVLLKDAAGDELHYPAASLPEPARLIVKIVGGMTHVPRITLTIDGISETGTSITEKAETKAFLWQNRTGVYTTQRVFAQVDRVQVEGLSRVYRLTVQTPDLTRLDINALLPLWAGGIPADHAQKLVQLATDGAHFWRTNGITMISAQDNYFDQSNADGGGGLWLYWNALVGEGLLEAAAEKPVAELLRKILTLHVAQLQQHKSFAQFYHADGATGVGERNHLGGIPPLDLLNRALGISIVSAAQVWVGGAFAWQKAVTVEQHGVVVKRSSKKINIKFPSGHKVDLPGDAAWQSVSDPQAKAVDAFIPPELPEFPGIASKPAPNSPERIIIKVERD
jgi:hypothetical protein